MKLWFPLWKGFILLGPLGGFRSRRDGEKTALIGLNGPHGTGIKMQRMRMEMYLKVWRPLSCPERTQKVPRRSTLRSETRSLRISKLGKKM